jgi:hypothetical protein
MKTLASLSNISLIEITNCLGSSSRSKGINLALLVLSKAKN